MAHGRARLLGGRPGAGDLPVLDAHPRRTHQPPRPARAPRRASSTRVPSIERVLGYTPDEVVGTSFARLLPSGEQGRLLHLLDGAAAYDEAGGTEVLECALRHRDGEALQFEIQHTNLLHDEHVRGIVLNSRDVSERKAFEDQLQHQAFHAVELVTGDIALAAPRSRTASSAPVRAACDVTLTSDRRMSSGVRSNPPIGGACDASRPRRIARSISARRRMRGT